MVEHRWWGMALQQGLDCKGVVVGAFEEAACLFVDIHRLMRIDRLRNRLAFLQRTNINSTQAQSVKITLTQQPLAFHLLLALLPLLLLLLKSLLLPLSFVVRVTATPAHTHHYQYSDHNARDRASLAETKHSRNQFMF